MSGDSGPTSAEAAAVTSTAGGETAVAPTPGDSGNSGKRSISTPPSSGTKKRPYRRTKRPKNYCDKSTVTTTTPTAHTPVNVYDAVLGECEDLLKASLEAQRLGRLKMASAYQLLLHTRLVGLGKRFDRATVTAPIPSRNDDDEEDEDDGDESDGDSQGGPMSASGAHMTGPIEQNPPASAQPPGEEDPKNLPPALQQLTSILPSNLEMDTTMMEHLARAAVELHHQRTGRKKSADGLLASPMSGMIGTPPADTTVSTGNDNTKVAWTPEEQKIVEDSVAEKKATYAIAKLLKNKTEAQVKAFLKNQAKTSKQTNALADDLGSPSKKRGGRGRKPPTTAMNTVPNANLDARSLLQGQLKR